MAIDQLNWYKATIQATDGTQKEVYLPSRPTAEGAQPTDTTLSIPGMPADAASAGQMARIPALKLVEINPVPEITNNVQNKATVIYSFCVDGGKMFCAKQRGVFSPYQLIKINILGSGDSTIEQTAELMIDSNTSLYSFIDSSGGHIGPVDIECNGDYLYIACRGGSGKPPDITAINGYILVLDKNTLQTVQAISCHERPTRLTIATVGNYTGLVVGERGQFEIYAIVNGLLNLLDSNEYSKEAFINEWQGSDAAIVENRFVASFANYTNGACLYAYDENIARSLAWHWNGLPSGLNCFATKIVRDYVYASIAPTNAALRSGIYTKGLAVIPISGGEAKLFYIPQRQTGINPISLEQSGDSLIIKTVGDPDPSFMCVDGERLYMSNASAGVAAWDISNPAEPKFVGNVDTGNLTVKVVVKNNLMFTASRWSGWIGERPKVNVHLLGGI